MLLYFLTFISFSTLALLSKLRTKSARKILYLFSFLIFWLFAGLRGDVGQDTLNYGVIYNDLNQPWFLIYWLSRMEPVMVLLMYFHRVFVDNLTSLYLIISLLQTILIYRASKALCTPGLFLVVYAATLYLNFHFNVIRVGLGLGFFLISLGEFNSRKSLLYLFLSIFSHLTFLILLPIYLMVRQVKVKVYQILVVFTLSIAALFFGRDLIEMKISSYFSSVNLGFSDIPVFGLIMIVCYVISLSFVFSDKQWRNAFLIGFFYVIAFFFSYQIDIFYRISHVLFVITVYVVMLNVNILVQIKRIKGIFGLLFFVVIIVAQGYIFWNAVYNEKVVGSGNADFNYIPYSLWNDSQYRK